MTAQKLKQNIVSRLLFDGYAEYARRLVPIFIICCFLFIFSLGMGYLLGGSFPSSSLKDLLGQFPDTSKMSLPELFGFIAANNIGKSLIFMLGGVLGGILPLFFVVFNGFVIGYVVYSIGSIYGIEYVVIGLSPHGVFEVPAILFSMSIGVSLGYTAMNSLRGEGSLTKDTKHALGLFLTRVVPILLIAAAIEVIITPALLLIFG